MTPNPKLKSTVAAITNLLNQEGPLSYDDLLAMTGKSPVTLSAALNEMINTGLLAEITHRSTGKNKYTLTTAAEKEEEETPAADEGEATKVAAKPKRAEKTKPAHEEQKPAKPRFKRLAANPMVGCYLHKGNIILKLDRRANNNVSLGVADAEIFLGLLSSMIEKAKGAEK